MQFAVVHCYSGTAILHKTLTAAVRQKCKLFSQSTLKDVANYHSTSSNISGGTRYASDFPNPVGHTDITFCLDMIRLITSFC